MAEKSGVRLNWGGLDKAVLNATQNLHSRRKALLAEIGEALVSGTMQRFEDGVGPDGEPWEPSQRALATGGKTLVDTAQLRNSISAMATTDAVYVGSKVVYARIHQMGGKTGRGHAVTMPARPYLGVSKEDRQEIRDIVADFLRDMLGK